LIFALLAFIPYRCTEPNEKTPALLPSAPLCPRPSSAFAFLRIPLLFPSNAASGNGNGPSLSFPRELGRVFFSFSTARSASSSTRTQTDATKARSPPSGSGAFTLTSRVTKDVSSFFPPSRIVAGRRHEASFRAPPPWTRTLPSGMASRVLVCVLCLGGIPFSFS